MLLAGLATGRCMRIRNVKDRLAASEASPVNDRLQELLGRAYKLAQEVRHEAIIGQGPSKREKIELRV